jgi:hypothetical protein
MTWHGMAWHGIAWHCMALHYITLHYITLHYITLHYIPISDITQFGPHVWKHGHMTAGHWTWSSPIHHLCLYRIKIAV